MHRPRPLRRFVKRVGAAGAVILACCSGCLESGPPKTGSSAREFQNYYLGTRWYWAHVVGLPESVPGYKAERLPGAQVHLLSNDEQRMLRYTELEPRGGMKAFHGLGTLEPAGLADQPLFRFHGDSNRFIGFFGRRLFESR